MRNLYISVAKTLLLFTTLLTCTSAFSTNYYFSNSIGNDSRTQAQAQNPATPWKTLNKLNSFFGNLQSGDSVLFKRGDTFDGLLTVSKSGSTRYPIIIASYGAGDKPIISGFKTLSNWTNIGNGIWESGSIQNGLSTVNLVTINDVPTPMGRYPNENTTNKGYLFYQSHSGATSITSNQISRIPDFVGAELVLRIHRSYTDRCLITDQTYTTITYAKQSGSTPTDGFGFFFQNSVKTLDKLGEWYYNTPSKKMDMYFGNNTPSSYTVKISAIDTLVSAKNASFITFNNISFRGANQIAIAVNGGSNFTLQNCEILYSGKDAITIAGTSGFKVDNCFINYSNSRGFNGYQSNISGPIITNSTIKNTGVFPGMGWKKASDGVLIGLEVTTPGSLVQNNNIINTGYHAIRFSGNNTVIKNNYIDTFCFNKDDGGGIYNYVGSINTTFTGMKVQGNIVLNGIGATEGSNSVNSDALGIYLDDNSNGIEISNNSVANTYRGIFLHNARNVTITGNTFYNNDYQIRSTHDILGNSITNCILKNNIIFSKTSDQINLYINSISDDVSTMGKFDSNYYCRPIFEPNGIQSTSSSAGGNIRVSTPGTMYYSLDEWKSAYGKDANSHKTITTIADTNQINFKFNATNISTNISLAQTYIGVDGKTYSGNIIIPPYSSLILLKNTTRLKKRFSRNNITNISTGKNLILKVKPNPSSYYFDLSINSKSNKSVTIKIMDISGRLLETTNLNLENSFQFGHNFIPGIYIVEVIQGEETAHLKVIKQPK